MNIARLLLLSSLGLAAIGNAHARDLRPDEALRLRDAGTIKSFETLNQTALKQHPGARVGDTDLEERHGRFTYELELHDQQGKEWDIEMDAVSGEILRDELDS